MFLSLFFFLGFCFILKGRGKKSHTCETGSDPFIKEACKPFKMNLFLLGQLGTVSGDPVEKLQKEFPELYREW